MFFFVGHETEHVPACPNPGLILATRQDGLRRQASEADLDPLEAFAL
jgi:hypothetical protein